MNQIKAPRGSIIGVAYASWISVTMAFINGGFVMGVLNQIKRAAFISAALIYLTGCGGGFQSASFLAPAASSKAVPTFGITGQNQMSLASAQSIQDTQSPCRPFRLACQAAGFTLVGAVKGDRLIADCMDKLLAGQPATNSISGLVAAVPVGSDASACAAHVHHGKKPTTGNTSAKVPSYKN